MQTCVITAPSDQAENDKSMFVNYATDFPLGRVHLTPPPPYLPYHLHHTNCYIKSPMAHMRLSPHGLDSKLPIIINRVVDPGPSGVFYLCRVGVSSHLPALVHLCIYDSLLLHMV